MPWTNPTSRLGFLKLTQGTNAPPSPRQKPAISIPAALATAGEPTPPKDGDTPSPAVPQPSRGPSPAPRDRLPARAVGYNDLPGPAHQPLKKGQPGGASSPAEGGHRAWGAYGRVVRCEPSAMGYRLAVEFDPLPAA